MGYTYIINKNPTGSDFRELCKRIPELYPDYERTGGKKYADGAENVRWKKGGLQITVELEADPAVLTVNSDAALPELEREYRINDKKRKVHSQREQFYSFFHKLTENSVRVKFLGIPLTIFVVYSLLMLAACALWEDFSAIFAIPLVPLALLGVLYVILGWVWLIPAGIAIHSAARLKSPLIVKLFISLLPALSVAYSCKYFDLTYYSDEIFGLLPILPLSLPLLYIAALPYLAVDEIACRRLEKITGKRPKAKTSVICWILSFIAAAGVLAGTAEFERNFGSTEQNHAAYNAQYSADSRYEDAQRELIFDRFGSDIYAVAAYSFTENCTDWRECPDKSLEASWRRLFLSGAASYDITIYDSELTMEIYGVDVTITAVPEKEGKFESKR